MPLTTGVRLGPYEIVSPLGTGGMGEVYRARDTRLDRLVALKVMSDRASDDMALERFQREARAASALNHPNICTIYDVGVAAPVAPGSARLAGAEHAWFAGGIRYLVMELLDGETLEHRLARGPLTVAAIIDLGVAIADALDAAHSAGIIHRDIKPANIFLAARGPKILDFGLAKTAGARTNASTEVTAPPEAMRTEPGSTIGTIAYMSPEQLRGEDLDARSDLFSFGLVLYEMAAGRKAFTGATSAVIAAGILHQEPAGPRQLRADLPAPLDAVILKALVKDRQNRCQSAAVLRADLQRLKRETDARELNATIPIPAVVNFPARAPAPPRARSSDARPPSAPPRPSPSAAPPKPALENRRVPSTASTRSRHTVVASLAITAAIGAVALVAVNRWIRSRSTGESLARSAQSQPAATPVSSPAATPPPSPPTSSNVESRAAAAATAPGAPAAGAPIEGDNLRVVALTTGGRSRRPAISADGSVVAYVQQRDEGASVWIHRLADGNDRQIVGPETGVQIVGVTVAPDGSFVDYVRRRESERLELWRARPGASSAERIVDRIDSLTAWSPDGEQMAFVRAVDRPASPAMLLVADRQGRNERPLGARRANGPAGLGIASRPGARPAWSPDGRMIAVAGFDRRAAALAGAGLERRGGGFNRRNMRGETGDQDNTAAGRGGLTPVIVFVDAATGRERTVPTGLPVSDLAWISGHTLVLDRAAESGSPPQLWRFTEPGGQISRLTTDGNGYADVGVTADGKSLVTTRYERRGQALTSDVVAIDGLR